MGRYKVLGNSVMMKSLVSGKRREGGGQLLLDFCKQNHDLAPS
jgi:hypothetical protein